MNLSGINEINKREAYRYMGFKNTLPDENFRSLTEKCERDVLDAAKPRFVYRIFDIVSRENGVHLDGTSLVLQGENIKALVKECPRVGVFAATLGTDVDSLIRRLEATDITYGFIADNLASALIEQVCDKVEEEIINALGGVTLTTRFSCGYGDLPLESQGEFLKSVDAQNKIGLCMTDTLIMIPRKSVTAVMGIRSKNNS